MITYKIRLHYSTGDSFNTYDTNDYLEMEWKNSDIVEKNLERIKEHYEYVKSKNRYPYKGEQVINRPTWLNIKKHRWPDDENYTINLLTDEGEEWQVYCFWMGYFEHLQYAEIVTSFPTYKF